MKGNKLLFVFILGLVFQACTDDAGVKGKEKGQAETERSKSTAQVSVAPKNAVAADDVILEKRENFKYWRLIQGIAHADFMSNSSYFIGPVKEIRFKKKNADTEESNYMGDIEELYNFNRAQQIIRFESISGGDGDLRFASEYHYDENRILKKELFLDLENDAKVSDYSSYVYSQEAKTDKNVYFSIDKTRFDGIKIERITQSQIKNGYRQTIVYLHGKHKKITTIELTDGHIAKIVIDYKAKKRALSNTVTQTFSYDDSGKLTEIEEFSSYNGCIIFRYVFSTTENGGTKIVRHDLREKNFQVQLLEDYDKYGNWRKYNLYGADGELISEATREISYYED